jgi:hypothetical protein
MRFHRNARREFPSVSCGFVSELRGRWADYRPVELLKQIKKFSIFSQDEPSRDVRCVVPHEPNVVNCFSKVGLTSPASETFNASFSHVHSNFWPPQRADLLVFRTFQAQTSGHPLLARPLNRTAAENCIDSA